MEAIVYSLLPITTAPTMALRNRMELISKGTTYSLKSTLPRFWIRPMSPVPSSVMFRSVWRSAATSTSSRDPPATAPAPDRPIRPGEAYAIPVTARYYYGAPGAGLTGPLGADLSARSLAGSKPSLRPASCTGWNVTPDQVAALNNGTQIALYDQNWPQQAAFGAVACAQFAKSGKILPNTQQLTIINKANLASAQKKLADFKTYALTGLV